MRDEKSVRKVSAIEVAMSAKMGLATSRSEPIMIPYDHAFIRRSFDIIEYACLEKY